MALLDMGLAGGIPRRERAGRDRAGAEGARDRDRDTTGRGDEEGGKVK